MGDLTKAKRAAASVDLELIKPDLSLLAQRDHSGTDSPRFSRITGGWLTSHPREIAADVDLDDPNFERTPYGPWVGYDRSKTRSQSSSDGIKTELGRHLNASFMEEGVARINADLGAEGKGPYQPKTVPQGAATSVWTAVFASSDEIGGRYCEDCHVSEVAPNDQKNLLVAGGVRAYPLGPQRTKAVRSKSEEMVGKRF